MRRAECEHCKSWVRYNASRFECARALGGFDCAFVSRDGWKPKTYEDLEQDLEHKKIAIRSRNARIKELEAQREEMKCPQNCKNGSVYNWSDNSICMDCEKVRTLQEMCKGCKYWELRR